MAQQSNKKWYEQQGVRLPNHVVPGQPRREVAQEFFTNVLELGRIARAGYIADCKAGRRDLDVVELKELDDNIEIIERELAKYK